MASADGALASLSHPPQEMPREALQRELDDAIIRTAGSHRRDDALSAVHVSPSDHARVQSSILTSSIVSRTGLGALDRLPLELLLQALRHMDMQTLFNLRRVNLAARQMVDSLKEYRAVVSHGLTAYCALLRMRLAAHVTLLDFYRVLCSQDCAFCGNFGGFVFLPSWIRCCFECIEEDPETRMVTVAEVRRVFRLSRAEVGRQRVCRTMPGLYRTRLYSTDTDYQRRRLRLAPFFPAMREFGDRLDTGDARCRHWPLWNPAHNFMASCELPYYDPQTRSVEYGISCAGCDARTVEQNPGESSRPTDVPWDRLFSRDNFLKHFKICKQAQKLWESSPEAALEAIIKRDVHD